MAFTISPYPAASSLNCTRQSTAVGLTDTYAWWSPVLIIILNFKVGSATAFPLPAGLAVNDIGGSMIIPVMTNTTLCFSVFAAWKAVQCLTGQSTNLPYLSYEAQALQSLRKQLLVQGFEAITDAAITAAALLWATATMFPQPDALRRHAAGVRSLVNARCGLDKLGCGGAIQQSILWADFLTAQFLGEDVLFKEADNALDCLPTSLADIHDSFIIPSTFECLLPQTIKAAKDLRLLLTCHDRARKTGRLSVAEYKALMNLLNRSTIQRISLEHQFKNSNSIDECAILAMNLMRLTVLFTATSLPTIVIKVIGRLRDALIRCGLDRSMHFLDTYIWACFVGMVHEINTPMRDGLAQLVGRALKIKYESLVPSDWQAQTLSTFRSFLWSDAVLTDQFADACGLVDCGYGSPPLLSQSGMLKTSLSLREPARKPVPNRFLPDRHHSAP
ncbi:hypothetical protein LTS07_010327 [Exophiala sideris]|uniref:Transcription factor domain-containing protein n=1 Tax=Exophiala sideris TaxID=1016849 RepID=A0ABR0IXH7_9EURO|nr:hypothetical protein LTS07_010327 [Exophiala sideris]KAK5023572.1 hypothetical protein LTR13_011161 [Exophiala sideris]KAK5051212.1 hypothetical protein LTR69_010424 [Exophiala sideris]KAK5176233.1 hypothetical protein LTR44_011204 [Eurotiomycetes sp. CCFEE 6388]